MSITLTESAAARIATQLVKQNAIALRFGAKSSGCSGFSYVMEFAHQVEAQDIVFDQHGVQLVIDPKSLGLLDGTQIDYVAEGLNQTFKFSNPLAVDECGCGESFSIQS